MKKRTLRLIIFSISLLFVAVIGYRLFHTYRPAIQLLIDPELNKQRLMRAVRSHGVSTAFLLILLTSALCVLPGMPASVIGVLSGISYGPLIGSLISIAGNATGNFFSIFLYKKFNLFSPSDSFNRWTSFLLKVKYPRIEMMFLYMIPFIPSSLVNFAIHLFQYEWKDIYWVILIGVIPPSLLYSFGGHVLLEGNNHQTVFLITGLAVILLASFLLPFIKDENKRESSK